MEAPEAVRYSRRADFNKDWCWLDSHVLLCQYLAIYCEAPVSMPNVKLTVPADHRGSKSPVMLQMLKQNKDQIHQALENSPPRATSKRHQTQAGPAANSGRLSPRGKLPFNMTYYCCYLVGLSRCCLKCLGSKVARDGVMPNLERVLASRGPCCTSDQPKPCPWHIVQAKVLML